MSDDVFHKPNLRILPAEDAAAQLPAEMWGKRERGVQRARAFGQTPEGHTLLVAWDSANEPVAQLHIVKGDSSEVIRLATEHLAALLDVIDPPGSTPPQPGGRRRGRG